MFDIKYFLKCYKIFNFFGIMHMSLNYNDWEYRAFCYRIISNSSVNNPELFKIITILPHFYFHCSPNFWSWPQHAFLYGAWQRQTKMLGRPRIWWSRTRTLFLRSEHGPSRRWSYLVLIRRICHRSTASPLDLRAWIEGRIIGNIA